MLRRTLSSTVSQLASATTHPPANCAAASAVALVARRRCLHASVPKPSSASASVDRPHHHDHHHPPLPDLTHPPTLAYYTGNAKYYDLLYSVQSHLGGIQPATAAAAHIAANQAAYDAVRKSFKSRDSLAQEMQLKLSERQYDTLVNHLSALRLGGPVDLSSSTVGAAAAAAAAAEDPEATHVAAAKLVAAALADHSAHMSQEIKAFLSPFLNPAAVAAEHAKAKTPDQFGRAYGTGSRKTSRAKAWVVPGNGQVCVNGVPVADYFLRREVEALTYPLQVAKVFGKYNVWVVAHGGGTTGQAEAGAVAVARALTVHEPEVKDDLNAVGLLDNDTRQVERKKPGQAKARKKFAWVKR